MMRPYTSHCFWRKHDNFKALKGCQLCNVSKWGNGTRKGGVVGRGHIICGYCKQYYKFGS